MKLRCILALFLAAGPALAQNASEQPKPGGQQQLRGVEREIERSSFEQRRLQFEIDNLTNEARKLRQQLLDVTRRVRAAEDRMSEAESRLEDLAARETSLRQSLAARERVTVEVLAAMQRIGRKAPPALLVSPDDVLGAMRAAILLGAVLPEMRDEALALIKDLRQLSDIRREASGERLRLERERDLIGAERTRLSDLIEQRQRQIATNREQLDSEKARVATLSREARSLRDLIARSENEIVGHPAAAEIARRAPAPQRAADQLAALRPDATGREASRLQPKLAFAEARGRLPLPVTGIIARAFGQPDGLGGVERGITIQSIRDAIVVAPADGWVHFAAPYRGYGHLVILNAGSGYHIVMAGMDRLSVEIGQFVLAGEPLGNLGLSPAIQPGENVAQSKPALYVEFRKDGQPVDPAPWWITSSAEKARG
jgi:septal ring factor EnvC (AmiA/AmiB activator)